MSTEISGFHGEYRWLSNFWPTQIMYEGIIYPSVEHAYQAVKTLDSDVRKYIATLTAGQAKKYGRVLGIREDWEDIKVDVMYDLLLLKFTTNPYLKDKLTATGTATLIEDNTWGDTYWGMCNGKGSNMLGRLLMKVRSMLVEEFANEK